jgi:hypothetical protein
MPLASVPWPCFSKFPVGRYLGPWGLLCPLSLVVVLIRVPLAGASPHNPL